MKSEAFVSILSGEEALAAAGSNISSISPCRAAKGPKGQTQALAMPLGMRTRAGAVPHLSHEQPSVDGGRDAARDLPSGTGAEPSTCDGNNKELEMGSADV